MCSGNVSRAQAGHGERRSLLASGASATSLRRVVPVKSMSSIASASKTIDLRRDVGLHDVDADPVAEGGGVGEVERRIEGDDHDARRLHGETALSPSGTQLVVPGTLPRTDDARTGADAQPLDDREDDRDEDAELGADEDDGEQREDGEAELDPVERPDVGDRLQPDDPGADEGEDRAERGLGEVGERAREEQDEDDDDADRDEAGDLRPAAGVDATTAVRGGLESIGKDPMNEAAAEPTPMAMKSLFMFTS